MASLNQLSVPLRQKGFYNCTKTWYIFLLSVAWLAYQLCPTTNKLFKISISKTFFSINILVVQCGSNFKGTRHVVFLPFLTHWLMLRSSISLFATHAVLRVVLKPENISSSAQAKQISACFVCVYASITLPFIAFQSLHSLFGSLFSLVLISGALELHANYFVFETFYLLPFLVSVSRPQGPFHLTSWVFNFFLLSLTVWVLLTKVSTWQRAVVVGSCSLQHHFLQCYSVTYCSR